MPELKKRLPLKAHPHPLEPALRQSVETGLKQNKLEPWQVLAWINTQYPEDNDAQVKLVQALIKSPLWKTMSSEVHFALREWFLKDVMTPGQIALIEAADAKLVSKDLFALIDEEAEEPAAESEQAAQADAETEPKSAAGEATGEEGS